MGLAMGQKIIIRCAILLLFFVSHSVSGAGISGLFWVTDGLAGFALPADTIPDRAVLNDTIPVATALDDTVARRVERVDTVVSPELVPVYPADFRERPLTGTTAYADTSMAGFHLYDFFSPGNPFLAWKGNVGHPARDLRLASSGGFLSAFSDPFPLFLSDPYQRTRFTHSAIPFYRPVHVFTDLYYVLGSSREQLFYAKHTQKLHEGLYVGMQYRLINSPGFYSRMGARNSNVYLTADYSHPGNRYQAQGSFIVNRIQNQQSGGLRNREGFEENPVRDSVFLYRAMSRYRETAIHLSQYYRPGFFRGNRMDTLQNPDFVGFGRFSHTLTIRRQSFVLDESAQPAPFYDADPVFSSQTYDSTRVHMLENRLSWSNFPSDGKWNDQWLFLHASLAHQLADIRQPDFSWVNPDSVFSPDRENYQLLKSSYNQLRPAIRVESNPLRLLAFSGSAAYSLGGYGDGNYNISGKLHFGGQGNGPDIEVRAGADRRAAPYFLQRYTGNYISWENQFERMSLLSGGLRISNAFAGLEGNVYSLGRMVYMSPAGLPEQSGGNITAVSVSASLKLGAGIFRSSHELHYQRVSSDEFERFPDFMSYHSLYADFSLFDRALIAHVGVDLTYNVPYNPMAYMPVVWQFYPQEDFNAGHVFMVDFFGNFRIQRTRFFVKLHNVLGLLTEVSPVYSIPFYPLPETAFKFGLSWMFFD